MPTQEQIRAQIWRTLKKPRDKPWNFYDLAADLKIPLPVLRETLQELGPYLELKGDEVRIRIRLDPLPPKGHDHRFWKFGRRPQKVSIRPASWENPLIDQLAPRDQGDRG